MFDINKVRRVGAPLRRLRRDRSAVAMMEFALALPLFLTMGLGGAELANFVTTKMRMSQVALHVADHAARMGNGSLLSAKTISETNINDVLTGAGLQAAELNLYQEGRVIITALEPVANPNPTDRFKITWKRCRGKMSYNANRYGTVGQTNMVGIGPTARRVTAPEGNSTMFVEVYYKYKPIIGGSYMPADLVEMSEIASMTVRERRDLSQIYNTENAVRSTC